jgi:pSer/pThr/pTyr-binding forkhead associated (FHA) protein
MTELFLEYINDRGEEKREAVEGERCIVGRHSESDIAIPDGRLSRKHLQIDRFADVFVASDAGSSNGTLLNGQQLKDPVALKNGDVLELGGLKVNVVFETDPPATEVPPVYEPEVANASGEPMGNGVSVASQPASGGSGTMLLWVILPVFGLIFIMFAGVMIFLLAGGSKTTVAQKQTEPTYSEEEYETENTNKKSSKNTGNDNSGTTTTGGSPGTDSTPSGETPTNSGPALPGNLSETAKIEQNGGTFLRNIAQNNPNAFLTTEQATKLSSKIRQFSGSSAVAANIASAKKSASQIKSLAQSKNLKPQFLAVAAINKLGNSKGDVYQAAVGMAEILDKLGVSIGNERADDALILIAVYDQGVAGDFLKMRNLLQDLATKSPESARAIRTIWYLQKNGNITQAEYENALNFLAIGTIAQNPKDFGMSAEPLTF